ncbi:hypothetical protein SUGI_1192160 [Cryptomeria japonica]|nr:hypothetical protein SUGI_1192160 [Cryptomeria japonica]
MSVPELFADLSKGISIFQELEDNVWFTLGSGLIGFIFQEIIFIGFCKSSVQMEFEKGTSWRKHRDEYKRL